MKMVLFNKECSFFFYKFMYIIIGFRSDSGLVILEFVEV